MREKCEICQTNAKNVMFCGSLSCVLSDLLTIRPTVDNVVQHIGIVGEATATNCTWSGHNAQAYPFHGGT
jgi:hypothetical protein